MSDQQLENRLYRLAAELFNVSADTLSPATSPQTVELWDSVGHLNLVLAMEEEFGVRFSPEQIDGIADLASAVTLLRNVKISAARE